MNDCCVLSAVGWPIQSFSLRGVLGRKDTKWIMTTKIGHQLPYNEALGFFSESSNTPACRDFFSSKYGKIPATQIPFKSCSYTHLLVRFREVLRLGIQRGRNINYNTIFIA